MNALWKQLAIATNWPVLVAIDCIGAKSYGMRTAFIDRRKRPFGQTPHQPDLIVANFAELAAALG